MAQIRSLRVREYTEDECDVIVDLLLNLRKSHIKEFLKEYDLAVSGTKEEIRERIEEALEEDEIDYVSIVRFVDSVAPWGKQHVYLYGEPAGILDNWKDLEWVEELLGQHRKKAYLNAHKPLILPRNLSLASIEYDISKVVVTAVERRDYRERAPHLDDSDEDESGRQVDLVAYVHHVTRGWVRLDWDLQTNTAMLQISQLHRGAVYEEVRDRFMELIKDWLDLSRFPEIDVRKAISRIHEHNEAGINESRLQKVDYKTLQGRRLTGHSASSNLPLLGGEAVIDNAMQEVREQGVGNSINMYWLPASKFPDDGKNPLSQEVRIEIVGEKSRINIPKPYDEVTIRHVLRRIRTLSA